MTSKIFLPLMIRRPAPRAVLIASLLLMAGASPGLGLEKRAIPDGKGALQFDGRDDFVAFEGPGRLALGTFTIETWFKRTGAGRPALTGEGGVEAVPILSRGGGGPGGTLNYFLGIRAADGLLVADFQDAATRTHHPIAGGESVREGTWGHAAATYDGTALKLYLDGRLQAEARVVGAAASSGLEAASLATTLDARGSRAGFFQGLVAETRVWERARTSEEIRSGMERGIAPGSGLVARWGLNEGAGGLVADSTGRHPSRTLFGASWTADSPFAPSAALESCVPTPSALTSVVEMGSAMKYQANLAAPAEAVLLEAGSSMRYLANASDPGIGLTWVAPGFDASGAPWATGTYGVGYETAPPGAMALIATSVPAGAFSIFTRASFTIPDTDLVDRLLLGVDYDDGYVAWINGVEVFRSPQMGTGAVAWNTNAATHESSNGTSPDYGPMQDITAAAAAALVDGANLLAIGVWNNGAPASTDLVLVPRLAMTQDWTAEGFNDSSWSSGTYGVGYDTGTPSAAALLNTHVPVNSFSVFSRARFTVDNAAAVTQVVLGADYDDGFVAYLNGVEVFRSAEMPAGAPLWNTDAGLHESSNGTTPAYGAPIDVTTGALALLHDGVNVLAVGVWNSGAATSTDLVLVPRLQIRSTADLCDGLDNDCDGEFDEDHVNVPTTCGVGICSGNAGQMICLNGSLRDTCDPFAGAHSDTSLVEFDTEMRYQANTSAAGMGWTAEGYDDSSWPVGTYGVGYEIAPPGADALLQTTVAPGTFSVFTRARFTLADPPAIQNLFLGADYDDGFVAWINGVEVIGSPEMPAGALDGTTSADFHESSNGLLPDYTPVHDISGRGIPALHGGLNVLAIGVWNRPEAPMSTDLVLVPRLSAGENDPCNGLDDDCDGTVDEGFANGDGDAQADCVDQDDDNDGIADGLDCSPLNPFASAAPPVEIQDVRWSTLSRPVREILWLNQGTGILYDVASGLASTLIPDGGADGAGCLANDLTDSRFDESRADPPVGDAYYYIVRAQKAGCGAGTYGLATSGAPRLPTSCP